MPQLDVETSAGRLTSKWRQLVETAMSCQRCTTWWRIDDGDDDKIANFLEWRTLAYLVTITDKMYHGNRRLSSVRPHIKQGAQLSQRDRAAGCVIVFAKSRRLELGYNILRTL